MENIEKGNNYEKIVCEYINKNTENTIAYLWKDVPDNILFECGFIQDYEKHKKDRNIIKNTLPDIGIDIIQKNIVTGEYIFVQCKNYGTSVCIPDLAGYFFIMAQPEHYNKTGHIYTSNNKISHNILKLCNKNKHKFISLPIEIIENLKNVECADKPIFIPYDYQLECLEKFNEFYENNTNGILTMPCGTGKTLCSHLISKDYNIVIILSPLKQFAEQNMDKFKIYDLDNKNKDYILVDSDGIRDINLISKKIEKNDRIIVSSTYKSSDIIVQLVDKYKDAFIIIDEFHNLSYNNIYNKDDNFYKIIKSENKKLYMSATPRIYELEGENDCNIEKTLGKIVYSMNFTKAIKNNYISDYEIYVPITDNFDEILQKINIVGYDKLLCQKVCYYLESLKMIGNMKSIFYFQTHEQIDNFIKCFNDINKYYNYKYLIDRITYDDSQSKRNKKLDKFKNFDGISILCSVGILDECIDIPECDSIYITYECQSKVRTIQRISRALRKHNNKIAKILVWCEKISELTNFISSIKEFDVQIDNKVKYIKCEDKLKNKGEFDDEQKYYVQKYNNSIKNIKTYDKIDELDLGSDYDDSDCGSDSGDKSLGGGKIENELIPISTKKIKGNIRGEKEAKKEKKKLIKQNINGKFECPKCCLELKNKQNLLNHLSKKYSCDQFSKNDISNDDNDDDNNDNNNDNKNVDTKLEFIDAKKVRELLEECKCPYCKKQFTRKDNTLAHIKKNCKEAKEQENNRRSILEKMKKLEDENINLRKKIGEKSHEKKPSKIKQAGQIYNNLNKRLKNLEDYCKLYK
jgi:superfamily II DNA or RNA helicase